MCRYHFLPDRSRRAIADTPATTDTNGPHDDGSRHATTERTNEIDITMRMDTIVQNSAFIVCLSC